VLITDKLKSYAVAKRKIMLAVEHSAQGSQQSGREFPPTDTTARADHEAVQVSAAGAEVSFHP
jgi:hypothetical protein